MDAGTSSSQEQAYDAETHLMQICDLLGAFSKELLEEAHPAMAKHWFHPNGFTKKTPLYRCLELPDWIIRLHDNDKEQFLYMLEDMLRIDPVIRKQARDLLTYPWLNEQNSSECECLHDPVMDDDDCSSRASSDSDDSTGTDLTTPSTGDEDDAYTLEKGPDAILTVYGQLPATDDSNIADVKCALQRGTATAVVLQNAQALTPGQTSALLNDTKASASNVVTNLEQLKVIDPLASSGLCTSANHDTAVTTVDNAVSSVDN